MGHIPVGFLVAYMGTIVVGGGLCILVATQTGNEAVGVAVACMTGLIGGLTFARSCRR